MAATLRALPCSTLLVNRDGFPASRTACGWPGDRCAGPRSTPTLAPPQWRPTQLPAYRELRDNAPVLADEESVDPLGAAERLRVRSFSPAGALVQEALERQASRAALDADTA